MSEPFSEVLREEAELSDVVQWGVTGAAILAPIVFSFIGAVTAAVWEQHGPMRRIR